MPPLEQMNEAKYNALMIAAATDETKRILIGVHQSYRKSGSSCTEP